MYGLRSAIQSKMWFHECLSHRIDFLDKHKHDHDKESSDINSINKVYLPQYQLYFCKKFKMPSSRTFLMNEILISTKKLYFIFSLSINLMCRSIEIMNFFLLFMMNKIH